MTPLASGDLLWPPETPESSFFSLPRYLNNQVFVSLANGELVVYQREAGECPPHPTPPTLLVLELSARPMSLETWLWAPLRPSLGLGVLMYKWGF